MIERQTMAPLSGGAIGAVSRPVLADYRPFSLGRSLNRRCTARSEGPEPTSLESQFDLRSCLREISFGSISKRLARYVVPPIENQLGRYQFKIIDSEQLSLRAQISRRALCRVPRQEEGRRSAQSVAVSITSHMQIHGGSK